MKHNPIPVPNMSDFLGMSAQVLQAPARKVGGSYEAKGRIVGAFTTTGGLQRVVFEFDDPKGMLHIFAPNQLQLV